MVKLGAYFLAALNPQMEQTAWNQTRQYFLSKQMYFVEGGFIGRFYKAIDFAPGHGILD